MIITSPKLRSPTPMFNLFLMDALMRCALSGYVKKGSLLMDLFTSNLGIVLLASSSSILFYSCFYLQFPFL